MKKGFRKSRGWAGLLLCTITLALPVRTGAQHAKIERIYAQTAEGVAFSVWIKRQSINYGQDIRVYYKVQNGSAKTIHLVRDNTSEPIAERGTILIQEPFVSLGGHEGYDYSFTKVRRGKTYQGQLTISRERYDEPRPWRIDVGFGYVSDITGLDRRLDQGEDPLPMKALLNSRIKTLSLGSLTVEVVKP